MRGETHKNSVYFIIFYVMKKNYYVFALVEAINCNPNWNPSDEDMPRIIPFNWDYKLEISSVSIKRKMRNAWSDMWQKVILDKSLEGKTIPQAYEKAFGWKYEVPKWWKDKKLDLSEIDLISIFDEYADSVFGLYNDGRVQWIASNVFDYIKQQQLVVSNGYSINNVWHKIETFRKWITSHFISKDWDNGGWMGENKKVDYALFPIVMNAITNYSKEKQMMILKWLVDWFNCNMTSSKNFNVVWAFIVETETSTKRNFVISENPTVDWYNDLKLKITDDAIDVKINNWILYLSWWKWYQEFENETTMKDLLDKYINYFNKN